MKILHVVTIFFALHLTITPLAMAADAEHSGHGGNHEAATSAPSSGGSPQMDHSGHVMDHSGHTGVKIHEAMVDGYHLAFHLLDNLANIKEAQKSGTMPEMDMSKVKTHHLMLYLVSPEGKPVSQARVGYLVRNPDGSEQKIMTMEMADGFGADVDFKLAGKFTIVSKSVVDGKTLIEEFEYTVK